MGGVKVHDRLCSMFSLCKFIIDIGQTNAWVYYKLCNKDTCNKEGAHADFFQVIAESMVNSNTNWQEYE
jgi:hypothetical protein